MTPETLRSDTAAPERGTPRTPSAVAAPRPRLVAGMAAGQLGIFLALLTPILVSLQLKVQAIVPESDQVSSLGIVTTTGSVAAMLANPFFGRLSDRTTSRYGRRRPWLALGMLGLFVGLLLIATASSVVVITLGFVIASASANAALAAFVATVADNVPELKRGKISGLLGIMQNLAPTAGTWIAKYFTDQMLLLFLVPSVIGILLVIGYMLVLPDKPLERKPPREGFKAVLRTYWVSPKQHPDFAWTWLSRFLLTLANWMFTTFRLIYLQHEMRLSAAEATETLAVGVLLYGLVVMGASLTAGWLSDQVGRRKPFIAVAAVSFGVGMLILSQADTTALFYCAEIVLGLGFGTYLGVDLALVIDVLPDPDNPSKDLGIFNIAMSAPQIFAPALGALLISLGGGHNYAILLITASLVCLGGALAILPVRKVR
ncbi:MULTISPECIES: MFS transporter [unclassified Streptomyces]|uniref:MFS transporter n=1 Tax=unclassified Streptomyces TaxID=2593676 RepID=UPI002DDA52CF|nr:MFS transporter [Streptomyces sp. NBC_01445]WSE11403.1 MFS transporter [Streptomyces sp. NBC_01445]